MGLSPSRMRVGSVLHACIHDSDHVDPYKLTHVQLYISDTCIPILFVATHGHIYLVCVYIHTYLPLRCPLPPWTVHSAGFVSLSRQDGTGRANSVFGSLQNPGGLLPPSRQKEGGQRRRRGGHGNWKRGDETCAAQWALRPPFVADDMGHGL